MILVFFTERFESQIVGLQFFLKVTTLFSKLSLKKLGTSLTHFLVLGRLFIPVHVLKNMKIQPDFTGQNWLKILKIASQKTQCNNCM